MHPITQACADKLQKEMEEYGYPPKFPDDKHNETSQPAKVAYMDYDIFLYVFVYVYQTFKPSLVKEQSSC